MAQQLNPVMVPVVETLLTFLSSCQGNTTYSGLSVPEGFQRFISCVNSEVMLAYSYLYDSLLP